MVQPYVIAIKKVTATCIAGPQGALADGGLEMCKEVQQYLAYRPAPIRAA